MRYDLVEKVLNDLKGIVPYKENIIWEDCNATSYLGRYYIKQNKIVISTYIKNEQDYLSVIAHELIHAAGVGGHRLEFKEYMNKINNLNLGYQVSTNAGKANGIEDIRQIRKEKRVKREAKAKSYIVWCEECGHHYITKRKCHKLRHYCCPKCYGKLRQKLYKEGKTEIRIKLH